MSRGACKKWCKPLKALPRSTVWWNAQAPSTPNSSSSRWWPGTGSWAVARDLANDRRSVQQRVERSPPSVFPSLPPPRRLPASLLWPRRTARRCPPLRRTPPRGTVRRAGQIPVERRPVPEWAHLPRVVEAAGARRPLAVSPLPGEQPATRQGERLAVPAGRGADVEPAGCFDPDGIAPAANGVAHIRLKRLEVQGFKTFATRTTLEFAPGITAIVGPNGSGKSNLAEAVRWVLGEQSSKLLRGRRGEDVIFAGGQGRAPMGMAEVSLLLDNAAGLLPAEFAEVAISRRLFRSGEHEYLINRQRVRLRDVVDLLSRAGIAQAGHSVIGQGMVDLALSLRPEERRALFEDAAGLRRFQAKQAEAAAKLSETRANAARVADLVAELEPRVIYLQRQARRAQDEARLRAQWQATLQIWLAHQRWELEHALAALDAEQARLDRAGQEARRTGDQATAQLAAARHRLDAAKEELAQHEGERAAAREALSEARRQLAVQEERHRAAGRAVQELQAEVERLTRRLRAAAARVPEAERDHAAAAEAARTARAAAGAAKQRLIEREREHA